MLKAVEVALCALEGVGGVSLTVGNSEKLYRRGTD